MGKGRIIYRGGPVIKNATLINAGNKFPNLRDEKGNIQWRLSVTKQAEPKKEVSALIARLNNTVKAMNLDNKSLTPKITYKAPSK